MFLTLLLSIWLSHRLLEAALAEGSVQLSSGDVRGCRRASFWVTPAAGHRAARSLTCFQSRSAAPTRVSSVGCPQ